MRPVTAASGHSEHGRAHLTARRDACGGGRGSEYAGSASNEGRNEGEAAVNEPTRATTRIDEVVDGIYRISTWTPGYGITFNQFLIDDERPALIHTGEHWRYDAVRNAVAQVLDPARLEFVVLLHFEADECGGMDRFVAEAPRSTLACSALSAGLNLSGWNHAGNVQGFTDGELLDLGRHKLRFLETPHVHHWDSMMLFDETTRSVFPADLYLQPGDQPPVVSEDLGTEMCAVYRAVGIFAHENPVRAVADRIEALEPAWMHAMHGGSLTAEAIPGYTRALREQRFGYEGKLLGREVVPSQERPPAAAQIS
jgi:flavorubredoxin